jgi:hypothetical protein
MKHFVNGLLVLVSILVTAVVAEGATRLIDGLPLLTDWLPNTVDRDVPAKHLDEIPRAAGVSRAWYFEDPLPLPNRRPVPPEWQASALAVGNPSQTINTAFRPEDLFKAWNSSYLGAPCDSAFFRQAPGRLNAYDPLDGRPFPRFRFLPNSTTPLGLVTNELGWRGRPVEIRRAAKVVRIVFVGASTTVNSHHYPFSYPEFVGHWLNLWAAARNLDVRFEALNAGREGMISTDIEAIVRTEVVPLRPDLVVYYEGANQFDMTTMLKSPPAGKVTRLDQVAPENDLSRWLRAASNRLALARRLQAALGLVDNPGKGEEWPKPDYEMVWPADERDPDLARADLPLNFSTIGRDLDRIRIELKRIDAELALSSFVWLAYDGMVLDPVRNKFLLEYLNTTRAPFRYRDIERAAILQNRMLAKYAKANGVAFLDVAGLFPKDPELLTDAIHMTYGGIRLHGWIVLQALVPLVEKHLANGTWPANPPPTAGAPPPGLLFTPRPVVFDCKNQGR